MSQTNDTPDINDDDLFVDDTIESGFAQLPVPANYLRWKRGNGDKEMLYETDPASFLGGWGASVDAWKEPHEKLPYVPFPIVTRKAKAGRVKYDRYASTRVYFQFIASRKRFEKWDKDAINPQTGQKGVLLAISNERIDPSYAAHKEVFGLAWTSDLQKSYPVVLNLNNWSATISYDQADQALSKIKVPAGQHLIRVLGTDGEVVKEKNAAGAVEEFVTPKFVEKGQAVSTPIEALDLANPRFVPITDEVRQLARDAQAWKNCPRWHAELDFTYEGETELSPMDKFTERAHAIGLTDDEIEQVLKENGRNPAKALLAIADAEDGPEPLDEV